MATNHRMRRYQMTAQPVDNKKRFASTAPSRRRCTLCRRAVFWVVEWDYSSPLRSGVGRRYYCTAHADAFANRFQVHNG